MRGLDRFRHILTSPAARHRPIAPPCFAHALGERTGRPRPIPHQPALRHGWLGCAVGRERLHGHRLSRGPLPLPPVGCRPTVLVPARRSDVGRRRPRRWSRLCSRFRNEEGPLQKAGSLASRWIGATPKRELFLATTLYAQLSASIRSGSCSFRRAAALWGSPRAQGMRTSCCTSLSCPTPTS